MAFIAGAVISFFTGSSWGTFAICIPIAVPMAYSFTGGQLGTLVYAAVAVSYTHLDVYKRQYFARSPL